MLNIWELWELQEDQGKLRSTWVQNCGTQAQKNYVRAQHETYPRSAPASPALLSCGFLRVLWLCKPPGRTKSRVGPKLLMVGPWD